MEEEEGEEKVVVVVTVVVVETEEMAMAEVVEKMTRTITRQPPSPLRRTLPLQARLRRPHLRRPRHRLVAPRLLVPRLPTSANAASTGA